VIRHDHLRHPLSLLLNLSLSSVFLFVLFLLSFTYSILFLFNKQYKSFAIFGDCSPFEPVKPLASTPSDQIALNSLHLPEFTCKHEMMRNPIITEYHSQFRNWLAGGWICGYCIQVEIKYLYMKGQPLVIISRIEVSRGGT